MLQDRLATIGGVVRHKPVGQEERSTNQNMSVCVCVCVTQRESSYLSRCFSNLDEGAKVHTQASSNSQPLSALSWLLFLHT